MMPEGYDWKSYLLFAKALMQNEFWSDDIETKSRVAVSRAYYAVFRYAQKFLQMNDLEGIQFGAEHDKVIRSFKQMKKKDATFQRQCKQIGVILERMKNKRVLADYRDVFDLNAKDVQEHFKNADKVITVIDQMKQDYHCK